MIVDCGKIVGQIVKRDRLALKHQPVPNRIVSFLGGKRHGSAHCPYSILALQVPSRLWEGTLMPMTPEEKQAYNSIWHEKNKEKRHAYNSAYHKTHAAAIKERHKAYYEEHKEEFSARNATWMRNNREERDAYSKAQYEKCKEYRRAKARAYYSTHSEEKRAYAKEYGATHREERKAYVAAYRAANPQKVRALTAALNVKHREKRNAYAKAYATAHPEERRLNENRRRARKTNAPLNDFTIEQWEAMKVHYGYCCAYCGKKQKRLTMDHITPLCKGGSHTLSNIVPACRSCNAHKYTGPPLVPVQPLLLLPEEECKKE